MAMSSCCLKDSFLVIWGIASWQTLQGKYDYMIWCPLSRFLFIANTVSHAWIEWLCSGMEFIMRKREEIYSLFTVHSLQRMVFGSIMAVSYPGTLTSFTQRRLSLCSFTTVLQTLWLQSWSRKFYSNFTIFIPSVLDSDNLELRYT